jgi:hypothetical protein
MHDRSGLFCLKSVCLTDSGSKSTTTYQAPGTGYQPMGRSAISDGFRQLGASVALDSRVNFD